MREFYEANLHHFIFVHHHIDEPKCITNILDFRGVVEHRHVSLVNVVELLFELQLLGHRACFFQISPSFFRCLRIPNVVEHLIMHTRCQAIRDSTCCLFSSRIILVWQLWHYIFSMDVTLVVVLKQVLVHLVFPRCVVHSVQLLYRKSTTHIFIHVPVFLLFWKSVARSMSKS